MSPFLYSKLAKRYSLLFIAVFTLMGLSYLAISLFWSQHYLQTVQTRVHLHVADTLVEDHHLVEQGRLNQEAITDTFKRYMLLNPHLEIYLLDSTGKILQYSANNQKILREQVKMQPILAALQKSSQEQSLPVGEDPRSLQRQKPFSVAQLPNNHYLYVIIQDSIEQEANRLLQESILLKLSGRSFLVSLLIGVILGGFVFYRLTRRILALSADVERFKNSPENPISLKPVSAPDEIDQLQQALVEMSQQIYNQLSQLKQTDQQRRFMISSLSHDLRTPLTNLLGYIELTAQQQPHKNLEVAYANGLKLKHYLDQLFDFSKLELDSFQLRKRKLSLSEFCFDLVEAYQKANPRAELTANITEAIQYKFDAVRMESAIRNLLDNALKYGQGAMGLSLKQSKHFIQISVESQGDALHEDFLEQLCQPFYQGDSSVKHFTGSGLGLAITKSIVEKHQAKLSYEHSNGFNIFSIELPLNLD